MIRQRKQYGIFKPYKLSSTYLLRFQTLNMKNKQQEVEATKNEFKRVFIDPH